MPLFRRARPVPLSAHLGLLVLFAAGMTFLWMVPVLLAGFPYDLPTLTLGVRDFVETGVAPQLSPLAVEVLSLLHGFLPWDQVVGWTWASACVMGLCLLPLWWGTRRLFDVRIAWCTSVIFAFMPLYWTDAVSGGAYPFAYFFLFLGIAVFAELHSRSRWSALLLAGMCFGAALASSHAFLAFIPWLGVALLWRDRADLFRGAKEAALFFAATYACMVLPLLPNALSADMGLAERIGAFLPVLSEHETGYGHLYPDEYAYTFLRAEFDRRIAAEDAAKSFLEREQGRYVRVIFNIGSENMLTSVWNGLWLSAHTIPQLFLQEYLGGAFLWLFILPGAAVLYRTRRTLFLHLVGLWLTMEFLLRFVLHYGRTHLMDIGWGFALLAAVGVVAVCEDAGRRWKHVRTAWCVAAVMVLIVLQLGQANRQLFAHHYARTSVPEVYAAGAALNALPRDAVVAHPRLARMFYFSGVRNVAIHTDTVEYLADSGDVASPFQYYGITHILGYSPEQEELIRRAVPAIRTVEIPASSVRVPVTPLIRYLLHLVR